MSLTNSSPHRETLIQTKAALRILLVEDHEVTRKTMARLLVHHGFVMVTAGTIAEAKQVTEDQDHFNLMISDIGLPDGTGVELMNWLRIKTPGLPAIALTAYGSSQDQANTAAAGFATHLTKPIEFEELVDAILRYASPTQH